MYNKSTDMSVQKSPLEVDVTDIPPCRDEIDLPTAHYLKGFYCGPGAQRNDGFPMVRNKVGLVGCVAWWPNRLLFEGFVSSMCQTGPWWLDIQQT